MALCIKGGLSTTASDAAAAAAAASSRSAAGVRAAASFVSRGTVKPSVAAKRAAGLKLSRTLWERRGIVTWEDVVASPGKAIRRYSSCGVEKTCSVSCFLLPPTGMHASSTGRAAAYRLRNRPMAASIAASDRPLAKSRECHRSSGRLAFAGMTKSGGLLQPHSIRSSISRNRHPGVSQQQMRGFAFPSLRFFANTGGGSYTSPETTVGGQSVFQGRSSSDSSLTASQQHRMLQQEAETNLNDAQVQQRYLAALNSLGESHRAVQHVEKFKEALMGGGMNEAVLTEYVKALCSSGLIHQEGRSLSQVVQRYVAGGGRLEEDFFKNGSVAATRDHASANSNLTSLLQQHQTQQQQLLQQQLMVQLQQLVHQLQVEGAQQRAAAATLPASAVDVDGSNVGGATAAARDAAGAASVTGGPIGRLTNTAAGGGAGRRFSVSAAVPLAGWRRYSPLRIIKWFCRGFWGLLKACNRGLWGVLLSPVVAVFLFWSFLNDGVHAVQNSVKNMEGSGGLGSQAASKKASEWVAGKVVKPEEVNTSFADVKGCEEVKKEVVEVVEYLKAPAKFTAMGARLPKGVLLQGPPGTGKTLLARAIAGEAGVPFIHASGSDFEEMYVGVGASRLRQLFAEARKRSPCILFIDEIDALGGRRTLTENKHHRQTLNQLLTELDGFKPSDGVTLICATNLAEALDPALTRPGRIDRIIHVPLPCKKERIDILQHYAVKMPLAEDVDLDLLASLTSGMTGADLANLLNFAAIRAATEGKSQVTLAEVEESFDRLMVGNRRSSVVMKEEERRVTAYHESGHALMCLYTPGSLPLHKATILFRGSALGVTWSVNREESFSKSLKEYLASLDVAMGGKAAEEIVFGKGNVTSGCFNDLQKATRVARNMVTGFGMGVEESRAPMVVSGKEYSFLSDESKKKVDEAVQRLLDQSYERARTLLTEKRDELERLAQALLEHETLTADEIRAAVAGTIDSAAIRERRKQKTAAAQVPKSKVKNGDEGEGEEEQQPPSALLRSTPGEGSGKRATNGVNPHGSSDSVGDPTSSSSAAAVSVEQGADMLSYIPISSESAQGAVPNSTSSAQGETAATGLSPVNSSRKTVSETGTSLASGGAASASSYSVAPHKTVAAVSKLLAAAAEEPPCNAEQQGESQQQQQSQREQQRVVDCEKASAVKQRYASKEAEVQTREREAMSGEKPFTHSEARRIVFNEVAVRTNGAASSGTPKVHAGAVTVDETANDKIEKEPRAPRQSPTTTTVDEKSAGSRGEKNSGEGSAAGGR